MGGATEQNNYWVGCGGHYSGTFVAPWLDIPATGHLAHMRFHEFFRFEEGKIVEIQALWDIPELMMQANAWPMAPSLGLEYHIPGPASLDGHVNGPWNEEKSKISCDLVMEMLNHMTLHPSQGSAEVMQMPKFWHPRMNWYGPAGIGTGRGIAGFRNWHQIPFLNAMPDRGRYLFAAGRGLRVGPVAGQLTVDVETSAARGLWSSIPASANPQSSSESAAWIVSW